MNDYKKIYTSWCQDPFFDEKTKKELTSVTDEKEIEDRFYKDLEFGTAGLRGIMGAGTNRMNHYTVGRATMGLAQFLLENIPEATKKGVVIGYDTRNQSDTLSHRAAEVFTAFGIPVYLFDQAVPTPVVSFAIRHLGCVSGVVLTASHNPPAYNGYKAYDSHGCQLGVEAADAVLKNILGIANFSEVPEKGNDALITSVGDELLEKYTDAVLTQSTVKERNIKKELSLVYTPIHGSGRKPVLMALKKDGFEKVFVVKEQEMPDGNFPTVKSPNPEERGALAMGIALADEVGADLVIGTDPDADRVGVATRKNGEMVLLTGNQVGALLVDFLLKTKTVLGSKPVVITTIVTGEMGKAIAEKAGVEVRLVLTGFKFIGEQITLFEEEQKKDPANAHHFVFGYEESYGYLSGTHARDKDAQVASLLIAEMAAYHKSQGKTLADALSELYTEHGYFLDRVESFTLQGKEGLEKISAMMETLRRENNILPDVEECIDYATGQGNLPRANVLKFHLGGGSWVAVRPSGTEPKIKFYYCIREENKEKSQKALEAIQKTLYPKLGL
ncbi:MAG: phospho-sugar mutase [Clostridia bacterium]|nr:phospho-sugar mutase [Clostridia bacterium]